MSKRDHGRHIKAADPTVPAAGQLLAIIRDEFKTIPAFCDAKGFDRLKVQKALRGEFKRMDLDFALAVETATDGRVKAEGWRRNGEAA